jgi:hypothetical protein
MKIKFINTYILFFSTVLLTSCWESSSWTEEKRETFRMECESQVYFDTDAICFTGFTFDEIDTVMVIEKNNLTTLDTLYTYANINRNKHDKKYNKYWGDPTSQFNVNNTYEFHIDTDEPYILHNMEMIMWAQYTMAGEGWGCEMGNFIIDKDTIEHQGIIIITKRGVKYE